MISQRVTVSKKIQLTKKKKIQKNSLLKRDKNAQFTYDDNNSVMDFVGQSLECVTLYFSLNKSFFQHINLLQYYV